MWEADEEVLRKGQLKGTLLGKVIGQGRVSSWGQRSVTRPGKDVEKGGRV
jgi:hypothetical protein